MAGSDIDAAGHRIRYEEAGSGPAVLLLHAGGADSGMWDDVWDELARSFRVIRFDSPGASGSPGHRTPRRMSITRL